MRRVRGSTLFPYTTLFRSGVVLQRHLGLGVVPSFAERRGNLVATDLAQPREEERLAAITRDLAYDKTHRALNDLDRKSTRLNSSHVRISYAVFCLKKKKS